MAKYRRLFNKIAPNPVSRRNVFLNWHQPSRRVGVPYHSQDYVSAVLPIGEASTAGCGLQHCTTQFGLQHRHGLQRYRPAVVMVFPFCGEWSSSHVEVGFSGEREPTQVSWLLQASRE